MALQKLKALQFKKSAHAHAHARPPAGVRTSLVDAAQKTKWRGKVRDRVGVRKQGE